jgi:mannose-6-phosphate isomerase-like protein (cupin superfamily)
MPEKINLKETVNAVPALFQYLGVGKLNNHMLNVLKAENRTLDFHIHEASDELFYCIEGAFDMEFDDETVHMEEGDLIIIPKGTKHRPVCTSLVKCLLIEIDGTLDAGNTGGATLTPFDS